MKTLIGCEFKKLLGRRAIWLALAVCVALMVYSFRGNLSAAFSGRVQGMRYVYGLYEGQVLTDALCEKMIDDYKGYAAAHPEWFQVSDEELGYYPTFEPVPGMGRAVGLALTYQQLSTARTKEYYENQWSEAKDALRFGKSADGNTLSPAQRNHYEFLTSRPAETPVVRYDIGWTDTMIPEGEMSRLESMLGANVIFWPPLLALLVLWMVPAFAMERGARMEPVLLSAAGRRRAAWAKALAGVAVAAAVTITFCVVELGVQAATLGLDGAALPSRSLSGLTNLESWALSTVAMVLSASACAAVVLAASALGWGSLAALGVGGTVLAAQVGLHAVAQAQYAAWWSAHATTPWWQFLLDCVNALPLRQLTAHQTVNLAVRADTKLLFTLLVPLTLGGACLWLAARLYLRRRKV